MSEEPAAPRDSLQRSRLVERAPLFYGWIVVAAGALGVMMTLPGQTTGVSIFIDHLIADLGLTRSGVSTLYLFGTLGGSLFLPFVGRFVDRRGPRVAVVAVAAAFALACVWMGNVRGAATLLVGFTLVRALGQGALSLVSLHVVAIWFVRRRGIAIGLVGIGMALATATFPTLIESLIEGAGWRNAYMLLGLAVALTIVPVGGLVFRDRPERYGVAPDGAPEGGATSTPEGGATSAEGRGSRARRERHYTADQARRTLTFWVFLSGLFLGSTLGTGLVFHHYSILAEGGLERALAARTFVFYGITAALANLATGALITRIAPRFLLSAMLMMLGSALVFAGFLSGPASIVPYGLLLGMRTGMYSSLSGNVFAYYFGRKHLGSIKGWVSTVLVIGSAVGPLILGLGYDRLGSYTTTVIACSALPFAVALITPFLALERDGVVR